MIAQDVIDSARTLLAEPNSGQRWSDGQLLGFVDDAQEWVVRSLKWPEARYVFTAEPNVQEYQLQEVVRILRVYINGQKLIRTSIPQLEGETNQLLDYRGQDGGPGGLVQPNASPVLTLGPYTPLWTSASDAYPVQSVALFAPSPVQYPWFIGSPPRYYMRGGNMGFVPTPIAQASVVIDAIAVPEDVTDVHQALVLPKVAKKCLAWKVVEFASFADPENKNALAMHDRAEAKALKELSDLQPWRREYDGVGPRGPNMLPVRTRKGQHRSGWGNC